MFRWKLSIGLSHPLGGSTRSKELSVYFPSVRPLHTYFLCIRVGPKQGLAY